MRWDLQRDHLPRSPGKGLLLLHRLRQLPRQPLSYRCGPLVCQGEDTGTLNRKALGATRFQSAPLWTGVLCLRNNVARKSGETIKRRRGERQIGEREGREGGAKEKKSKEEWTKERKKEREAKKEGRTKEGEDTVLLEKKGDKLHTVFLGTIHFLLLS